MGTLWVGAINWGDPALLGELTAVLVVLGIITIGVMIAASRRSKPPLPAIVTPPPVLSEPILMSLDQYERERAKQLREEGYEVALPSPDRVYLLEKQGWERDNIEHQGQIRAIVVGGSFQKPDNIPMRKKKPGKPHILETLQSDVEALSHRIRKSLDLFHPSDLTDPQIAQAYNEMYRLGEAYYHRTFSWPHFSAGASIEQAINGAKTLGFSSEEKGDLIRLRDELENLESRVRAKESILPRLDETHNRQAQVRLDNLNLDIKGQLIRISHLCLKISEWLARK